MQAKRVLGGHEEKDGPDHAASGASPTWGMKEQDGELVGPRGHYRRTQQTELCFPTSLPSDLVSGPFPTVIQLATRLLLPLEMKHFHFIDHIHVSLSSIQTL